MAIKIEKLDDGKKLNVQIDNGHVEALNKIVDQYNIKSIEDAIGFMLSVFVSSEGKPVEINGQTFVPAKKILKDYHGE